MPAIHFISLYLMKGLSHKQMENYKLMLDAPPVIGSELAIMLDYQGHPDWKPLILTNVQMVTHYHSVLPDSTPAPEDLSLPENHPAYTRLAGTQAIAYVNSSELPDEQLEFIRTRWIKGQIT